jgi:hypothetical protein
MPKLAELKADLSTRLDALDEIAGGRGGRHGGPGSHPQIQVQGEQATQAVASIAAMIPLPAIFFEVALKKTTTFSSLSCSSSTFNREHLVTPCLWINGNSLKHLPR